MKLQISPWVLSLLPLVASRVVESIETRDLSCGVQGYDTENPQAYGYYKIGIEACNAKCATSFKCLSFAIGNNRCYLYDTTV